MYVCLCNGFTDGQVRAVSREASGSAAEVYCRPRCGKCVPMVRDMVRENPAPLGAD